MMALLSLGMAVLLQAAAAMPPPAVNTVEKGQDSVMEDARNVTVRSQAEWMKVWRMHNFEKPAPKVDFAKDMVVGVFMGSRPSAGFSVAIVGTRVEAGKLVVQYREDVPARGTMTAQILTSPYHLVSVPKVDGEVKFEPVTK